MAYPSLSKYSCLKDKVRALGRILKKYNYVFVYFQKLFLIATAV